MLFRIISVTTAVAMLTAASLPETGPMPQPKPDSEQSPATCRTADTGTKTGGFGDPTDRQGNAGSAQAAPDHCDGDRTKSIKLALES